MRPTGSTAANWASISGLPGVTLDHRVDQPRTHGINSDA